MIKTKSILTKSKDWSSFKRTVDTLDNKAKAKGDAFEDQTQAQQGAGGSSLEKLRNQILLYAEVQIRGEQ